MYFTSVAVWAWLILAMKPQLHHGFIARLNHTCSWIMYSIHHLISILIWRSPLQQEREAGKHPLAERERDKGHSKLNHTVLNHVTYFIFNYTNLLTCFTHTLSALHLSFYHSLNSLKCFSLSVPQILWQLWRRTECCVFCFSQACMFPLVLTQPLAGDWESYHLSGLSVDW